MFQRRRSRAARILERAVDPGLGARHTAPHQSYAEIASASAARAVRRTPARHGEGLRERDLRRRRHRRHFQRRTAPERARSGPRRTSRPDDRRRRGALRRAGAGSPRAPVQARDRRRERFEVAAEGVSVGAAVPVGVTSPSVRSHYYRRRSGASARAGHQRASRSALRGSRTGRRAPLCRAGSGRCTDTPAVETSERLPRAARAPAVRELDGSGTTSPRATCPSAGPFRAAARADVTASFSVSPGIAFGPRPAPSRPGVQAAGRAADRRPRRALPPAPHRVVVTR